MTNGNDPTSPRDMELAEEIYSWISDHETRRAHCIRKIAAAFAKVREEAVAERGRLFQENVAQFPEELKKAIRGEK